MDRVERERIELDKRKHTLEERKHGETLKARNRELDLRAEELVNQRKLRYTNLSVAAVAAVSAVAGAVIGAWIQGSNNSDIERYRFGETHKLERFKAEETIKLEKHKLESSLIAKAGESSDVLQVVARLRFWIQLELIPKELQQKLELSLNQDPTLLSSTPSQVVQPPFRSRVNGNCILQRYNGIPCSYVYE